MKFSPIAIFHMHPAFQLLQPHHIGPSGGGCSTGKKRVRNAPSSTVTKKRQPAKAPSTHSQQRCSPRLREQAARHQQDQLGSGTALIDKLDAAASKQITQSTSAMDSDDASSKDLLEETQVPSSQPLPPRQAMLARQRQQEMEEDDVSFSNHADDLIGDEDEESETAEDEISPNMSPHEFQKRMSPDPPSPRNTDSTFDAFDPAFDHTAQGFPFGERLRHTLRGQKISKKIRTPVEMAVLCEAYRVIIEEKGAMKAEHQHSFLASMYSQIIDHLKDDWFESSSLKQDMMRRRKGSAKDATLDGNNLKRQYGEMRSSIRKMHGDFPDNFADIPSGKQLHQLIDDYIAKTFADVNVSDYDICFILFRPSCI